MKTIWKYLLNVEKFPNTIPIPRGAKFLALIEQNNMPVVYFEVDETAEQRELIQFFIYGTGCELIHDAITEYLGTVSTFCGGLIWHIYCKRVAVL